HGVLNTDNMNISGESFDYGPWRWLPAWDANFTAAYFDHSGLYAFGRQPEAINWNCGQLAVALRLLADSEPLIAALNRFGPLYRQAMARRFAWRLGIASQGEDADVALIGAAERHMRERAIGPDAFFFTHRGGRTSADGEFGELLSAYKPAADDTHSLWRENAAPNLIIEEVERVWDAIDKHDDWEPLNQKVAEIRMLGGALKTNSSPPR
ncbi:MAG: selenoprotein O, partial [Burkholderiales bacterium]